LALELVHPQEDEHVYAALNAYWEPLEFQLPALAAGLAWHRLIDTALPSPQDVSDPPQALPADLKAYRCDARSTIVLVRGPDGSRKESVR
jgi:glycogen operon protein